MDKIKDRLNHAIEFMEQDNRGVQLSCYSVALVGLSVAIRRVRPFSRFRKPSDIPSHFINERRELTGVVKRIDPNGALLMVQHKPLVELPGIRRGELPVKISGIHVTGLGLTWLQTVVVGREVRFIPLAKAQDYVHCQVMVPQVTKKNKEKFVNVGESLVKVGFGQVIEVQEPLSKDPMFLKYWNQLVVAEDHALRKKMGLQYYVKPTLDLVEKVGRNLYRIVFGTYRQIVLIPKLPAT